MKIRFTTTILIFFCFLAFKSQAQTSDITQGCFPLLVNFSGPAGQPAYFWNLDNGVTAMTQNVSTTFVAAGTYEAELREGQNGPLVGTITIEVYEKPIITISADPMGGCVPLNVAFQSEIDNEAINVTNYQWTFGDGQSSSQATPNNTYQNTGTFDIGLEIETDLTGCNNTEQFPDFISVTGIPAVSFTTSPNPPVSCTAPLTVSFNNTTTTSGLTYEWDFGNGQTSMAVDPPDVTYTEIGSFTVTLTATDNVGCSRSVTRNVNLGNPVASFTLPDTICLNEIVSINNNSTVGAYTWDLGADASPPTSNFVNPNVSYSTPGIKNITLNVTAAGGCTGDTMVAVFVQEVSPDFELTKDPVCEEPFQLGLIPVYMNADATYDWSVTRLVDGVGEVIIFSSDEMSPLFDYVNSDTTIYSKNGIINLRVRYSVTSPQGCMVTGTLEDIIYEPNALFMPDVVDGCAPVSVVFSDSSTSIDPVVSYTYFYGDGQQATFTNDNDHSYIYNDPGEYDVVLIIENDQGCRDTSYAVRIEVGAAITPDFTVTETTVCPGDTVQFTDLTNNDNIDGWHFSAEEGRSSHCFQEDELFYNFDNSNGPQDITLQVEYNGCFSEVTKTDFITVNGPIAKLDYEVDCETPFNIAFRDSSLDATSITWDFGDSTSSMVGNLSHLYDSTGNYKVYLTAENDMSGCPASVDSAIVYVKEVMAAFEVDSFICIGTDITLDGSMAQDVDNRCWKGYDWQFSWDRPITTMDTITNKTFDTPGDHTVFLVANDINGCRDTASQDVWVFSSEVDFTISDTLICIPSQELMFTDMSVADTTLVSWEWDFGDMGMATDTSATHTYTQSPFPDGPLPGPLVTTVLVTLTTEDILGCPGMISKPITIYEPTSTISTDPSPANICVGSEVAFEGFEFLLDTTARPISYSWNFGNGMTSMMQMDTAQYDQSGTFTVSLDIEETATGCQNMRPITTTVQVQDFPIADFTTNIDDDDPICYPKVTNFMDNSTTSSPLSQMWDFGNGSTSNNDNPSITLGKGMFTVTYIASTSFGCRDTTMRDFTLVGPEGDFIVDQNLICLGDIVNFTLLDTVDISSFRWEFGDGDMITGGQMVSHEYDSIGTFVATLVLTGVNGICETTPQEFITVQNLEASFEVTDACFGPIQFVSTSTGPVQDFFYDFGNGLTSIDEDPIVNFPAPGNQTVELVITSSIGCQDTVSQDVAIFANPQPLVMDNGGCQDTDITLSVENSTTGSFYDWSPEVDNNGAPTVVVNLSETTTFTIVETDGNDCQGMTTATVEVVPAIPEVEDVVRSVCEGDELSITLPTNPFYTYRWTVIGDGDTNGLSCIDCPNPTVTINGSVTYQVVISDQQGTCPEVSATFTYSVPANNSIGMPNAFSADGNDLNDNFNFEVANDNSNITVNIFQVFDRYGKLVYDNNNPATGWDGRFKGKLSNSDVYLYNVELSVDECITLPFQGDVTLIR